MIELDFKCLKNLDDHTEESPRIKIHEIMIKEAGKFLEQHEYKELKSHEYAFILSFIAKSHNIKGATDLLTKYYQNITLFNTQLFQIEDITLILQSLINKNTEYKQAVLESMIKAIEYMIERNK